MIYGVGTDICDVRRIAATFARRGERFAEKVLGPHEIEAFRTRLGKVESRGISYLATRFSAKDSVSAMARLVSWSVLDLRGDWAVMLGRATTFGV